ncbi:protease complex subunit PrcB family protein [Deinococcus hohokamensis]|uniref:Protease complex subunit PrcB family protein n=1 Tax=Deinococcus hohokamensis TaxID=309883 RepID=A0ABV9I3A8_9DEIO
MTKTMFLTLGVSAGLLSACAMTGPGNLRVHEALLYGGTQERITWVYGQLGSGQSSLKLGGQTVDLRAAVQDPLTVAGSLSVNGKATYRTPTTPLGQKFSVTRGTDGLFTVTPNVGVRLQAVYYTDGASWQKLSGTSGLVRGAAVRGLQGAGQLTSDEAAALGLALQGQGPLAVAVFEDAAPDAPLAVEPRPTEHLVTALYVLPGVRTTATLTPVPVTPAPVSPAPVTGAPLRPPINTTPPVSGGRVTVSELARGTNANVTNFSVQVATTQAAANALYAQAYGRQTSVPAAPSVSGSTLVGVFLGQRSTGGYGVQVTGARVNGSALTLIVRVTAPGPGSITTQAITSPWAIVRVPGSFSQVSVVDEQGQPLTGGNDGGEAR